MGALEQPGEIIVVDNNSTDDTADIARALGARVVSEPINQISRARNAGAAVARGGFFIFVDADTQISANVLGQALRQLREEIWLSMALARWGRSRQRRFVVLRETVTTSARKVDWLSAGAIIRQILIFALFPLAVRSKRFCGAWYVRPGADSE